MPRPKLKITLPFVYKLIEVFTFLAVLVLIAIPIYYWNKLPTQISINGGETAHKALVLMLPIIGVCIYILVFFMQKIPHHFNYAVKITIQNAAYQYTLAVKMIAWFNLFCMMCFMAICYFSMQHFLENKAVFGLWITLLPLICLIIVMVYFVKKMIKGEQISL